MQNIEKSLTPAQRARLKVYWHLAITGLLTGALTGLGLVDQFKTIDLRLILVSVIVGAFLAFADGLRKYYQASGEVQKAAAVGVAENIVVNKSPAAPAQTALGQEVQQIAQAFIAPPQPASAVNPALQGAFETVDSIPDIAVIKAQFKAPLPTA